MDKQNPPLRSKHHRDGESKRVCLAYKIIPFPREEVSMGYCTGHSLLSLELDFAAWDLVHIKSSSSVFRM